MKSRISVKPCPLCGKSVKIYRGLDNITFFRCDNEKCRALISFGGPKKTSSGTLEAENPIDNFNRRAGEWKQNKSLLQ